MRRTRRHKYLQLSVIFLIYSIIHVVSVSSKDNESEKISSDERTRDISSTTSSTPTHSSRSSNHHNETLRGNHSSTGKEPVIKLNNTSLHNVFHKHIYEHYLNYSHFAANSSTVAPDVKHETLSNKTEDKGNNVGPENEKITEKPDGTGLKVIGVPVVMPHPTSVLPEAVTGHAVINKTNNLLGNCTPPAIRQFPHPIMSPYTRRHGGLIIHIVVAVYMFLGLAIVCDEYFVASLDRICEELKMSPDVAGATFMAAGSSAPELATVIIGVFFAKDDIGISGVIGSAVFNIMFVISCCGLCSATAVYLNWWPLVRDCFFYAVSILVMLVVISNKEISWFESLSMLFVYLLYCIVLHFNTPLEKWAQTLPVPFKHTAPTEQSGLVSYKTLEEDGKHQNYGMDWSPEKQPENPDQSMNNFGMEWSPEKHQQSFANQLSGPALNQATIDVSPNPPVPPPRPKQHDYYKPKEYDPSAHVNPLIKPEGGIYKQFTWGLIYPIHWLCRKTMPDCRSEKYKNWYPFTFFVSMVWISFYSYFMVWMITIIGYTMGIPDTVMGLTFVAAGVSVPDALSSIAVIKEGYGDMAVSNAVGSNVFDILICLGLPWFIKTAIIRPGTTVRVISKGLTYSTLSLLSTVIFLVIATHINGWKLDRRFGVILMIWYLIFITFASMYELNLFGQLNPPECTTDW